MTDLDAPKLAAPEVNPPPQGQDGSRQQRHRRRPGRRLGPFLARHWLFLLVFLCGAVLRSVVTIAYWPALEFYGDSYDYLNSAKILRPGLWHPFGYGLFLYLLSPTRSLGAVTIVQHLMGLATGLLLYLFLLRLNVRAPLAALSAVPVLLDAYQLDLEQFVLAETLTSALLLAGLCVLGWRARVSFWQGASAALLLAVATLTRFEVLGIVMVGVAYLLLRRQWRALAAYCLIAAVLILGYGRWYQATYGYFGFSSYSGVTLYGRVAPFATCRYPLKGQEARLCPTTPVARRTQNQETYVWGPTSPLNLPGLGSLRQRNQLAQQFAEEVIAHQPLDYLRAVAADTWHYFTPGRSESPNGDVVDLKRFQFPPQNLDGNLDNLHTYFANVGFGGRPVRARVDAALIRPLRDYQSVAYTQGPLLLAALIAGLLVGLRLLVRSSRRRQARWVALLLATSGLVVAIAPSLTTGFSYRYGLPLLVLLPPAGAIGADLAVDALRRRLADPGRRGRPPTWQKRLRALPRS